MQIKHLLTQKQPVISFEFFPPKTDQGMESLMETLATLKPLSPSFVSMTYGAGGSTREKTVQLVSKIKNEIGIEAVAHLTCVGHSQNEIENVLNELKQAGIENILALRGDPPKGQTHFTKAENGFSYATELVKFIKSKFSFCLGVAGYPEKHIESKSFDEDLKHLNEKVKAGGDFVVTQLFFDNTKYFSYVDKLKKIGVTTPIVPGIMPITDFDQIKRFASMCGATLPETLLKKLEAAGGDKEKVAQIGIDHATSQCVELLAKKAPGIHFYTLNKSQSTREIFIRLKQEGLV